MSSQSCCSSHHLMMLHLDVCWTVAYKHCNAHKEVSVIVYRHCLSSQTTSMCPTNLVCSDCLFCFAQQITSMCLIAAMWLLQHTWIKLHQAHMNQSQNFLLSQSHQHGKWQLMVEQQQSQAKQHVKGGASSELQVKQCIASEKHWVGHSTTAKRSRRKLTCALILKLLQRLALSWPYDSKRLKKDTRCTCLKLVFAAACAVLHVWFWWKWLAHVHSFDTSCGVN